MSDLAIPFPCLAVALAYAFSDERHTSGRPAMARAADDRLGEPGPLAGMDGAAEIGKARQFLERGLEPLYFAVLYAKYGQRKTRCKHCGSPGDDLQWLGALRALAGELADFLRMPSINSEMRFALVRRYFEGSGPALDTLAERYVCRRRSVERANVRTIDWLRGSRAGEGGEPVTGVEQVGHAKAAKLLRAAGFIP